jgi:hypothetical protein
MNMCVAMYLTSRNAQKPGATCAAVSRPYRTLKAGKEQGKRREIKQKGDKEMNVKSPDIILLSW